MWGGDQPGRALGRYQDTRVHHGVSHIHQHLQNAQTNLGESIHSIGRTRSMRKMQPSSPGADEMTYANAPTCNGVTVPRWYASVTSRLDTWTGPWSRSASQTAWRMRGKA